MVLVASALSTIASISESTVLFAASALGTFSSLEILFALMVAWVAADELKIKKSFVMLSIVIQIVLILAGFYGIQLIYS